MSHCEQNTNNVLLSAAGVNKMFHALAFQEMKNQYYGVIVCYCSVLLKWQHRTV